MPEVMVERPLELRWGMKVEVLGRKRLQSKPQA